MALLVVCLRRANVPEFRLPALVWSMDERPMNDRTLTPCLRRRWQVPHLPRKAVRRSKAPSFNAIVTCASNRSPRRSCHRGSWRNGWH